MGRVAKAIKMLVLLKNRGLLGRYELAELLDETPRNILNIKDELEEAGYEFYSKPGKNGGYELVTSVDLPAMAFEKEDFENLKLLYTVVSKDDSMINQKEYMYLLERIIAGNVLEGEEFFRVYDSVTLNCDRNFLEKVYQKLRFAISHSLCVEMEYEKTNGEVSVVNVEPYYLVSYRNAWYLNAVKNGEERTYKINRINKLTVTSDKFRKLKKYKFNQNSFDLEDVHVELMIFNRNDISEYKYSDNQVIKRVDVNTFHFEADMKEFSAYALIKNLGKDCRVIQPEYLRDRLIEEAKDIIERYK